MSYNEKHNEANGEGNNDGESHNRSWNCGVEGETDDPEIRALRLRQQRNLLATLLLSQGVPMIAHGDEVGRTQHGNNNAYCQDSELAWVDWKLDDERAELLEFTAGLVELRRSHPVFQRRRFFAGDPGHGGQSELGDIEWFSPDGTEMDEEDWRNGYARTLMVFLNGEAIPEPDRLGRPIVDAHFLLLFNAHSDTVEFTVPPKEYGEEWVVRLDTTEAVLPEGSTTWEPGSVHPITGRSVVVLSTPPSNGRG